MTWLAKGAVLLGGWIVILGAVPAIVWIDRKFLEPKRRVQRRRDIQERVRQETLRRLELARHRASIVRREIEARQLREELSARAQKRRMERLAEWRPFRESVH